jgi:FAD/FMN-containing dehydrogenase
MSSASAIGALRALLGTEHVLSADSDMAPFLTDWRKRYRGRALAVVLPADTAQVAAVVRWCAATRTPVVPQGGNTGLVGGATPDAEGRAIVLATRRLRTIRRVDAANGSLVAEAGCVLADVQAAARDAGQLFPLSLAAEGSATIGGNLSTNAGGVQVLRYGNARELTLGLEVVLPSGEVWDGLRALRKDNTGYDLRDLYIGAEGTLGIITAACLKTFPLPRAQATALVAVPTLAAAVELLRLAQDHCGPTLTACESFNALCLALVERHYGRRSPLAGASPHYVLLELSDHEDDARVRQRIETLLSDALDRGLATDAALAQNVAQARDFWALRELISEAQATEGRNLKHDVAVPISALADFVARTDAQLRAQFGPVRMVTFGHLGDGNLHYNVSAPEGADADAFAAHQAAVYELVHDAVHRCAGSISAEHGVGQLKREEIARYKPAVELELMRSVKRALDPLGIMNPGKVL